MLNLNKKNRYIFLLGLLSMVKVQVLGTFALAEIVVLLSYINISFGVVKSSKLVRSLISMGCVWLAGVVIADIVNETSLENSVKGVFNVILLVSLIPGVYWAIKDNHRALLYFWLGTGISQLFHFYFQQTFETEFDYNVWQVYAYFPLMISLGGFLYYKNHKTLAILLTQGFAFWTLFNQSRLIFLTVTLANTILIYVNTIKVRRNQSIIAQYRSKSFSLLLMLTISFIGIDFVYEYGASHGYFGENVYEKYMMQKNRSTGLASGRQDFIMSTVLVSRNPIWGYGSYARDDFHFKKDFMWETEGETVSEEGPNMLPGHSYFMGAWVYAGLLGALFFLFVIKIILRAMKSGSFLYDERMTALYLYVIMLYIWNILFSPFADRLNFLFFIITLVVLDDYRKSRKIL